MKISDFIYRAGISYRTEFIPTPEFLVKRTEEASISIKGVSLRVDDTVWRFVFHRTNGLDNVEIVADWNFYGQVASEQEMLFCAWAEAAWYLTREPLSESTRELQVRIRTFLGDALSDMLVYETSWYTEMYRPLL